MKQQQKRLVQEKLVEAAAKLRIAASEKLMAMQNPLIRRNLSVKVKPKPITVSNIQKQAIVKQRIDTIRNMAKTAAYRSIRQIIDAARGRVASQKRLSLVRTKTKLNELVNFNLDSRIQSTRTAVSESMINESKQHGLNLEGLKYPTNIRSMCIRDRADQMVTNTLLRKKKSDNSDEINRVGTSLSAYDNGRINAGRGISDSIENSGKASNGATAARDQMNQTKTTLGNSSSGIIKDYTTLSEAVASHAVNPRIKLAKDADADAEAFRATRDGNGDPSNNGFHNKLNAVAGGNKARADSIVHNKAFNDANARRNANLAGMAVKKGEYDAFIRELDSPNDAVTGRSNGIREVGDNLNIVLKPAKTAAERARIDAEGVEVQNRIDIGNMQGRNGEVANRFSDFRQATKDNDNRIKDINNNNKKLSDLGSESAGYKNSTDQAESGLSLVQHDPINDSKFARLQQIRNTDLPLAKLALREAGKRRNAAATAKAYLKPDRDVPDLTTLTNRARDLEARLRSVKNIHEPAVENKALVNQSIRDLITDRNKFNNLLATIRGRIRSYDPTKPIVDVPSRYDGTKNTTILIDRNNASKAMGAAARSNGRQGYIIKNIGKRLLSDRFKYQEGQRQLSNVSGRRDVISQTIGGAKANRLRYDMYMQWAKLDIEGFRAANMKVYKQVRNMLFDSNSLNSIINTLKGRYTNLNSNGVLDRIKNRGADARTASRNVDVYARIRDDAQDSFVRRAKDRDITVRARMEAARDAKIHNQQSNNAGKRVVDAKTAHTNATTMDVSEDVSLPGSTSRYNDAITDVDTNLSSLDGKMKKAREQRGEAEGLEATNIQNINTGLKDVTKRSTAFGNADKAHTNDVNTVAGCKANLKHLAGKPNALKPDVDAALARAESVRPSGSNANAANGVGLIRPITAENAALNRAIVRRRDAEAKLKELKPKSTAPDPKLSEKVKLNAKLKEKNDTEEAKLKKVEKSKEEVDADLERMEQRKERLLQIGAYIAPILIAAITRGLLPGITPGILGGTGVSGASGPSTLQTPGPDPNLTPGMNTGPGSDYANGYNEGMRQGRIDGQRDGTNRAINIISQLDNETEDELIKEVANIATGNGNLDAVTAEFLKKEYCKQIISAASGQGIDPSAADSTCAPYYTGVMTGGYEEDENGIMIPKVEIYEGGAFPTGDYDTGYFAGYNYGYRIWYNAALKVTITMHNESLIPSDNSDTSGASGSGASGASGSGASGASGSGASDTSGSGASGSGASGSGSDASGSDASGSDASGSDASGSGASGASGSGASGSGASGASGSGASGSGASGSGTSGSGASDTSGSGLEGGGLKNAKRHLKRGNTFKQHAHLLGQIKGKTIAV